MPAMTDRVLLFDLGGVLIENDMFQALKRLTGSDASTAELIERWLAHPVARRFELGQCDPDRFALELVAAFELPLTPADFLEEFAAWPRGFAPGALELLSRLRASHRLACLSNSNPVHWHGALTEPFDHAFSSHLIGFIKPDAEAFEHVLAALHVPASDVLFFDDAESNVETARRLGMEAYRTVGFEALRTRLQSLGLVGEGS